MPTTLRALITRCRLWSIGSPKTRGPGTPREGTVMLDPVEGTVPELPKLENVRTGRINHDEGGDMYGFFGFLITGPARGHGWIDVGEF